MLQEAIDAKLFDDIRPISGAEEIKWARELAQKEGIFTGVSGGSTFAVARQVAEIRAGRLGHTLHAARHRRALSDDAALRGHRSRDERRRTGAVAVDAVGAVSAGMTTHEQWRPKSAGRPESLDPEDWDQALAVAR